MTQRPLRQLTLPDPAAAVYDAWLDDIAERLSDPDCDRYRLCRDVLLPLYYPGFARYEDAVADSTLPLATRAALLALDARNVTLEPEYYAEKDAARYDRVKPLLWLWQCFDRSPMGGGNVDIAVRFRRILAQHVFKRCGANFKCFQFVEFSFGYNMEVGDDVVVHRHVLLDDRAPVILHDRTSIADYANVYSHSHSITDQQDVTSKPTILGPGTRLTYHSTVLAGVEIGEEGMLGAMGLATRDIPPYHLALGIPARPRFVKDTAPPEVRKRSPLES